MIQQVNISFNEEAGNAVKCIHIVVLNQIKIICIIAGSITVLHKLDISNIVHHPLWTLCTFYMVSVWRHCVNHTRNDGNLIFQAVHTHQSTHHKHTFILNTFLEDSLSWRPINNKGHAQNRFTTYQQIGCYTPSMNLQCEIAHGLQVYVRDSLWIPSRFLEFDIFKALYKTRKYLQGCILLIIVIRF